ncbi:hypothetical protein RR48_04739 [Papilio machaon]|uniref:Uncharacterized protein n=1 Tax=Papilio machaon TaxID=76193 RepID=A0A0N1IHQ8_PAPMA|nr:hypothetical protein RR48_04739 [Papilio machaon]
MYRSRAPPLILTPLTPLTPLTRSQALNTSAGARNTPHTTRTARHAPHDTPHTTRPTRHAPHDTPHTTRPARHAPHDTPHTHSYLDNVFVECDNRVT